MTPPSEPFNGKTDFVHRPSPSRESVARLGRLALKELRETLRDRRTILTLVLMPLLVYPLLSMAFQRILITTNPVKGETYRIAVETETEKTIVAEYIGMGESILIDNQQRDRKTGNPSKTTKAENTESEHSKRPTFDIKVVEDLDAAVADADGKFDIGIRARPGPTLPLTKTLQHRHHFELIQRERSKFSRASAKFVERRLAAVNNEFRVMRLEQRGVPRHMVPAAVTHRELQATGAAAQFSMAAMIPLILILMTITGAVYPAIDLTAGERERGTLEMLVATPVPRMGLLLAKYSAVMCVAVLTATVNLVGMTVTVFATGLGPMLFGGAGLSLLTVVSIFGLMLLFAAFFSAMLLVLTSFARSFKEAQAYLIPLMLVSIAPGILSVMPDVQLSKALSITPLANIVLLARDLLQGGADPVAVVVVVLSTMIYAAAALSLAARIFGSDAILYGSHGSWSDLFRRPRQTTPAATITTAMMTLAILFPASILAGQLVVVVSDLPLAWRLTMTGVTTIVLFVGVPLATALIRRVRLPESFSLRNPNVLSLPAAVLLGFSLWPFVFELIVATKEWELFPISPAAEKLAAQVVEQLRSVSPLLVLLAFAVIPAVCEEFFFRGFLLSSLRSRITDRRAILASAVLFGLFHVVVREGLAVERLLPSTLMGLVLGWVCVRTGSLYPGVILHACHNGLLLMAAYYQPELIEHEILTNEQTHLPAAWLATAAAIAAVGFVLMRLSVPNDSEESAAENAPPLTDQSAQP